MGLKWTTCCDAEVKSRPVGDNAYTFHCAKCGRKVGVGTTLKMDGGKVTEDLGELVRRSLRGLVEGGLLSKDAEGRLSITGVETARDPGDLDLSWSKERKSVGEA